MTQETALKLLKEGNNVFLTGAAGAGKTYVLNQFINHLKENSITPAITASTGIAATHINGMTIHSFAGIGIKDALSEKDIKAMLQKDQLRLRFLKTKVLIIDEISMLHAHRLDMVDRVLRIFRKVDRPFGGMQVVLCGDFFQLPPVTRGREEANFAYSSEVWEQMDLKICYLTEQYRQNEEDGILKILNAIRDNNIGEETHELLKSRYRQEIKGNVSPTKLYTHNIDVDTINDNELEKITENVHEFTVLSRGSIELVELLKKSCLAPTTLKLKKGALVMFVKNNYEDGYVNGTLGKVVGFEANGNPLVEIRNGEIIEAKAQSWVIEDEGKVKAEVIQVPLRLAWAITIHKSQGMSLDATVVDLSKSFVPGMGYVALSRVRTLDGMNLVGFNQMALMVNQEVLKKDMEFRKESQSLEKLV